MEQSPGAGQHWSSAIPPSQSVQLNCLRMGMVVSHGSSEPLEKSLLFEDREERWCFKQTLVTSGGGQSRGGEVGGTNY